MEESRLQNTPAIPSAEIAYYRQISPPLLKVVRCIGLLAVICSSISLVILPIYLIYYGMRSRGDPILQTRFGIFNQFLSPVMAAVLNVWLLISGTRLLRRRPAGRRGILVWAWCSLVWLAYIVTVSAGYLIASNYRKYSFQQIVLSYGNELRNWAAGTILPLTIILLLRTDSARELFKEHSDAGARQIE